MLVTAVAPVASVGSPIDSGSRAGRDPNTPDSYTSSRSGATVRWARLHAMFGSPTPTKHTRSPASWRALATIIISAGVQSCSISRLPGPDDGVAPGPQLPDGDVPQLRPVQQRGELCRPVHAHVALVEATEEPVDEADAHPVGAGVADHEPAPRRKDPGHLP